MKIVFTSHSSDFHGGAQGCLFDLIKGIKEQYPHYEIYVIFPSRGNFIDHLSPYLTGYTIIKQPWWMIAPSQKNKKKCFTLTRKIIKYALKTWLYLRKIQPKVVVTNTIASPTTALACKIGNYKHVWFIHEVPVHTGLYTFIYKEATTMHLIKRCSHKVLVVSDYAWNYYHHFIPEKILSKLQVAVGLEIDLSKRKKNEELTLLFVGNFDTNKNQEEAVNACIKLKKLGFSFHLFLVGAVPGNKYVDFIHNKIESKEMQQYISIINFTQDISCYYQKADILLLCSATEAKPRVIIEAQKYGIPVIATNIDAHKELIKDKYNGLLYKRGEIDTLTNSIIQLSDSKTRELMGCNARLYMSDKFNINTFVNDFLKFL